MSKSSIILELGPGRLRAGEVRGGRLTRDAMVRFDASGWDEALNGDLRSLDQPLVSVLAALGVARGTKPIPVGLAYHAPTTACDVFSCPAGGSGGDEAALLALSDSFGDDAAPHPHGVLTVARDAAGEVRMNHRLIAAESDQVAERMTAWLERAGLRAEWIAPMAAFHLCELVDFTMDAGKVEGSVVLRVGEHRAHLAAAVGGRLRLVRHVSLDLATLTDAMTAPLTVRGVDGTREVRWDSEKARTVLMAQGIPDRAAVIEREQGVTGAAVLPALQPVLQRALVEVRQALRFGMEDPERASTRLMVIGPGAAVPHLGEVLAAQLGLAGALPAETTVNEGDLERAASFRTAPVNLLPRRAAAAAGSRRVRYALAAGTALALTWGGIEGFAAYSQTRQIEKQGAAMASTATAAKAFIQQSEAVRAERESLSRLKAAVHGAVGQSPDWGAWFNELATLLPPNAALTDIACSQEGGEARCEVRGSVVIEPGGTDLAGLVQRLEESPLVARLTLGGVQRLASRPGASEFQATIRLVGFTTMDGAPVAEGGTP